MKNNIPENINIIINNFLEKINEVFGKRVKKVILYGSYARGDYKMNSDIDIMILTDLKNEEISEYKEKIYEYAYDIEWENNFDIALSPVIKNIDRFNYLQKAVPFYMNVQKEGVVLSES